MRKKKYEVCASYTLCATYYLEAESEEEAMKITKDNLRAVTCDILAASYAVKTKYSNIKPEYIGEEIVVDSVEEVSQ